MKHPNHPGAEENQDDSDFLCFPYVFFSCCQILLCFPIVFHPGHPVYTAIRHLYVAGFANLFLRSWVDGFGGPRGSFRTGRSSGKASAGTGAKQTTPRTTKITTRTAQTTRPSQNTFKISIWRFIMVPELFRKLRETPGKRSHQVSSKSERSSTSYVQKTTLNKG